jgi:hypothetical protein
MLHDRTAICQQNSGQNTPVSPGNFGRASPLAPAREAFSDPSRAVGAPRRGCPLSYQRFSVVEGLIRGDVPGHHVIQTPVVSSLHHDSSHLLFPFLRMHAEVSVTPHGHRQTPPQPVAVVVVSLFVAVAPKRLPTTSICPNGSYSEAPNTSLAAAYPRILRS